MTVRVSGIAALIGVAVAGPRRARGARIVGLADLSADSDRAHTQARRNPLTGPWPGVRGQARRRRRRRDRPAGYGVAVARSLATRLA